MTAVRNIEPVQRICAVIAREPEWIETAISLISDHWGEIAIRSDPIPFEAGGFYDQEMGKGLSKVLIGTSPHCDPGELAAWKTQTNAWENQISQELTADVPRPVNLDPGYLSQAKLVLATIKDRDHRIYLGRGIFAEVTLNYVGSRWIHHRWTYPSYRTEEVAEFAHDGRDRLRRHLLANDLMRRP